METRANYVLIGSFTLAVIAAAFGFVLWFQSLHTTKARSPIRIVFEGPASGLRNGGSVNFNGIRIGEVISVKLDNPRRVVALAMVENNAPIRKDTLVGLEFQGLTGVAAISLKGGEEAAPSVPLDEDGVPVLTADPSALQDVTEAIRSTLQNVNRIVADNQESVKSSLKNLETFTSALARNSEKIDNVMLRVDGVMGKADSLMLGLNTIAGGAGGGELNLMVKSIRELADDFDKRSGALMADGRRTLADISRAVTNFDRNPSRVIFGGGGNSAPAAAEAQAPPPRAPRHRRSRRRQRRPGRSGSRCLFAACVQENSLPAGKRLDEPVEILTALEERLHQHALVAAVDAHVIDVAGQFPNGRRSECRHCADSCHRSRRAHHRQHHHPGKELLRSFLHRARDLLGRAPTVRLVRRPTDLGHHNLVVAEHATKRRLHVLHLLGRHHPAIDDRPRDLRQRVDGVPARYVVATQVVRNCALVPTLSDRRIAAGEAGSVWPESTARRSSASWPPSICAVRSK